MTIRPMQDLVLITGSGALQCDKVMDFLVAAQAS